MDKKYKVMDLFSGCGGLSCGFADANYIIKYAIDSWEIALKTLKNNHSNIETIHGDINNIEPTKIVKNEKIDVVIGGPPCQGFSIAGKREVNDERNILYKRFVYFVSKLNPKCFLMENVPNLTSMAKGQILRATISDFTHLGYSVSWKILKASDFGVPQDRKRIFIIGCKDNIVFDFSLLDKHKINPISSKEAISDLPENNITPDIGYPKPANSEYQKLMRKNSKGIYNHTITNHTEKTKRIISLVPDGGNYKDLPLNLQNTRKVNIAWTRLNSKKPSFTIDTGHRHHFHYYYNRVPTVREAARLQSFPDTFFFLGNKSDQEKQVGNAVPPLLAKILAIEIKNILREMNV